MRSRIAVIRVEKGGVSVPSRGNHVCTDIKMGDSMSCSQVRCLARDKPGNGARDQRKGFVLSRAIFWGLGYSESTGLLLYFKQGFRHDPALGSGPWLGQQCGEWAGRVNVGTRRPGRTESAPTAQTWPIICSCVTPWARNGFYTFKWWGEEK